MSFSFTIESRISSLPFEKEREGKEYDLQGFPNRVVASSVNDYTSVSSRKQCTKVVVGVQDYLTELIHVVTRGLLILPGRIFVGGKGYDTIK